MCPDGNDKLNDSNPIIVARSTPDTGADFVHSPDNVL